MAILDKLEKNIGWVTIPGLGRYISMLMMLTFMLHHTGTISENLLLLNMQFVFHGEIWRLITFLFVPASGNLFYLLFELMIFVMVADGLEEHWGSFKLTVYYLFGALATIAIAFLVPTYYFGSYYLNLSLFFAFATVYPDFEILIFFVLPVKVKYLALLSGIGVMAMLVLGSLPVKIMALLSVANYLVFFGKDGWNAVTRGVTRKARLARNESYSSQSNEARHKCAICGESEKSNHELEFRYCTCPACGSEGKAYCLEHLKEHKEKPSIEKKDQS